MNQKKTLRLMLILLAAVAQQALAGNEIQNGTATASNADPNFSDAEEERWVKDLPSFVSSQTQSFSFGIIITDSTGKRSVQPANVIPNMEGQQFGWVIKTGQSSDHIQWTETITAPAVGAWHAETLDESSTISSDERAVTTRGTSVPADGVIHHEWSVGQTDPAGLWKVKVRVSGKLLPKSLSFTLSNPLGSCPFWRTHLNWWWAKFNEKGDPDQADLSSRVLDQMAIRLAYHGFVPTTNVAEAYWQLNTHSSRLVND